MNLTPKRRWFRYSLRTLFVALTVFCCWLGYQLNWIRQRRDVLAWQEVEHRVDHDDTTSGGMYFVRAPSVLSLFGEQGVAYISLTLEGEAFDQWTERDHQRVAQIRTLFPESDVAVRILRGEARFQKEIFDAGR